MHNTMKHILKNNTESNLILCPFSYYKLSLTHSSFTQNLKFQISQNIKPSNRHFGISQKGKEILCCATPINKYNMTPQDGRKNDNDGNIIKQNKLLFKNIC